MGSQIPRAALAALLGAVVAAGQPALHLKTRTVYTNVAPDSPSTHRQKSRGRSPSHWVVQYRTAPGPDQLAALQKQGVVVLGSIPDNALLVSAQEAPPARELGSEWVGTLEAADKISPLLSESQMDASAPVAFLVEAFPDVSRETLLAIISEHGLEILEHASVLPNQVLVRGPLQTVLGLADWDEISYVFPASDDLVEGLPVIACSGAAGPFGGLAQYVDRAGDGWDGPGQNAADLFYYFRRLNGTLPDTDQVAEIRKALREWSRHVRISFQAGPSPDAPKTISFLFTARAHGDPFAFDGRGGVLAHTYYPAPPNPEPVAGDMHLDDDEPWRIGADVDLYSVVLHELGHALGLGHSDKPGAVMYPYYRRAQQLTDEDIKAIRLLYASQEGTPTTADPPQPPSVPPSTPPIPVPLGITIERPAPDSSVSFPAIDLEGKVTGSVLPGVITWSTDKGAKGTVSGTTFWKAAGVPLSVGLNVITVSASEPQSAQTARAVIRVTRVDSASTPAPKQDTTPPAIFLSYPAGSTFATLNPAVTIRGRATDNTAVQEVTCSTSGGYTTIAAGTDFWSCKDVPLLQGTNTMTIRARDTAGNSSWRAIVATRR